MDFAIHFSLEVFYYRNMKMIKEFINKIKYRFSIENISLNDFVVIFIICAYIMFLIMDIILPFRNMPMSFLILTLILFAILIYSHTKNNYLEILLNNAKTKRYEEKKKQAQAAYKRFLKQQQERLMKEREQFKRDYTASNSKSAHTEESKTEDKKTEDKETHRKQENKFNYKREDKSSKQNDDKKINSSKDSILEPVFFKNCTNLEQIEKTYKKLCQIYHPDQFTGDNEMFLSIKEEYIEVKKRYS